MATRIRDIETINTVIDEALAQADAFAEAARALQNAQPGTDAYEAAEADLAVEAAWLEQKANAVAETLADDEGGEAVDSSPA